MVSPVLFAREGPHLKIRLNRVAVLNAINGDLLRSLQRGLMDAAQDSSIRVVSLHGEGGCFSAGADIKELAAMDETALRQFHDLREATFDMLEGFPAPTMAVIERFALGTGLELAFCCDFKIAAQGARLGIPSAKLGIVESYAYLTRVVRAVGIYQARKMIFTGEKVSADNARVMGLVEEVVPEGQLAARTAQLAAAITANSSTAILETKQVIATCAKDPYLEGVDDPARPMAASLTGDECKERLASFAGKSPSRDSGPDQ